MSSKSKQFWQGMNNISKITAMINKRRVNIDEEYGYYEEGVILSHKYTREKNSSQLISSLTNKTLFSFFDSLLDDMYRYNFMKISSVDSSIVTTLSSPSDIDIVSRVSLLEHTCGVFNKMFFSDKKTYGRFLDFFLLAAIAHDFGKSLLLREAFGLSGEVKHHKNSALYLEQKLVSHGNVFTAEDRKIYELVVSAIRVQHDDIFMISSVHTENSEANKDFFKDNEFRNLILEFLRKADREQRDREISLYSNSKIST